MNIFRGTKEFSEFAKNLKATKILAVSDVNTVKFSDGIIKYFTENGKKVESYVFNTTHLVPEIDNLGEVIAKASDFEYVLAIGSGTINDICKYVAFKNGIIYGIFATAPSMDGYVSSVSALYQSGKKVTLPTTIPTDVLIDVDVLATAPIDMIVAGAGDMVGKYTSLLDWKLANAITCEKYDKEIVARMEKAVKLCIDCARDLVSRNKSAVSSLIEGLILSGVEMQNAGNSRPASGCEHHVSHYLEMSAEKLGTHFAPHGVQVALGSFIGNALYRIALEKNIAGIEKVAEDINKMPTVEELKKLYSDIGLPTSFKEIGVSKELLEETVKYAYTVRDRYTIFSLLNSNGLLEELAPTLAEQFA